MHKLLGVFNVCRVVWPHLAQAVKSQQNVVLNRQGVGKEELRSFSISTWDIIVSENVRLLLNHDPKEFPVQVD